MSLGSRVSRPDAERLMASPVLRRVAIRRHLPEDESAWTAEHLGNAACALVDEAARARSDRSPATRDHPSFLDLLHRNTVGRESYPALHAWCLENGFVVSVSTLRKEWKTRALEIVWDWVEAQEDDAQPTTGDSTAEDAPRMVDAPHARRGVPSPRLAWSLVVIALLSGVGGFAAQRWSPDGVSGPGVPINRVFNLEPSSNGEASRRVGVHFPSDEWSPVLGVASPPFGEIERPVFVTSIWRGAPHFALWDLAENVLVWESIVAPPPEQLRTHATLDSADASHTHYAADFVHTEHGATLGDVVAVLFHNRASASFIAFVDVRTGVPRSWYAHPGRLEHMTVYDADDDGVGELIAVGQDNVLDRPVIVALEAHAGDGAASSVMWSSGTEDAAVRVILPGIEPIQNLLGAKRLTIFNIQTSDVDRAQGLFRVEVGYSDKRSYSIYDVRFDLGLRRVVGGFSLPDRAHDVWKRSKLDPADYLRDLPAVTVFTGSGFLLDGGV